MPVCILTDSTAVFPASSFTGQKFLRIISLKTRDGQVNIPPVEDFLRAFNEMEHYSNEILVLTVSSAILPLFDVANRAAAQHGGLTKITVLDSRQTAAGLGLLAQIGAQAALNGASLAEAENRVRAAIPNVYTLLSAEEESGETAQNGDAGSVPIFSIEDGQMAPYKKVRTRRHLLETFQEFIEEFEYPYQIIFSHGPNNSLRSRPLRELTASLFPGVPFSEQELPASLVSIYGSQAATITVMEQKR